MKTIEIYLSDLKEEKQKEIISAYGGEQNFDVLPLTVIEVDEEEDADCHEDCTTCPQRQFGCINEEHEYLLDEEE